MRSDKQTKSLHYFHVYAVADRVDTSQSTTIIWDPQGVNLKVLLPSIDDERIMKENFSTHISRVLFKHMKHLQSYTSIVSQHILHRNVRSVKLLVFNYHLAICLMNTCR